MSIKKNTIWNLFGAGIPVIIGFIVVPYIISKVGVESFGILSLIWALIGYFGLFDFGLGRALTQQVSYARQNCFNKVPGIVVSGLKATFYLGIFGGIILILLSKLLAYDLLNVSDAFKHGTYVSLLLCAFAIPITTITSGLKGVIEGFDDFKNSNILRIALGVMNLIFPTVGLVFFKPNLEILVISLVIARIIIFLFHISLVYKKVAVSGILVTSNKGNYISLFKTGALMTVTNIIGPLMVVSDRFILSKFLGAKIVAYYTVPFDLVIKLLIIPTALASALFPRFSSGVNLSKTELEILFKKSFNIIFLIMFLVVLTLALCSHFILDTWLGKDFAEQSQNTFLILLVGVFFNCLSQVPFSLLQAVGRVKVTAVAHIIEFFLYIPILFYMLNFYGLIGVSLAWCIRSFIDFLIMSYFTKKYLK